MTITIEEAISLIRNSSKYRHSLLVSKIMATLAKYFDKPERNWMLVGLLHDLDYDHVEDFSQHGLLASKMLADKLPQEAIHAIQAHDFRSGVKPSARARKVYEKKGIWKEEIEARVKPHRIPPSGRYYQD